MAKPKAESYRLTLLGPWDLRGPEDERVRSLLSQPRRLCLLAYLALSGEPIARATIVALFWPESDEERARNALSQAVHYLRRSLSKDAVLTVEGDRLQVPREEVAFDVRALLEGEDAGADALPVEGTTEFFEGWNADDSQPLQEWLDGVRRRVGEAVVHAEPARSEPTVGSVRPGTNRVPASAGPVWPAPSAAQSPSSASTSSATRRLLPFVAAAGLAALMAVGFVRGREVPVGVAPDEPLDIVVLMPRVTSTGLVPPVAAEDVHDELIAALADLEGATIHSIRYVEQVSDLVKILRAQGAPELPELALTLSIRVADGRARVVSTFLRGPEYSEAHAEVWTYPIESEGDALIDLPGEIAADTYAEAEVAMRTAARPAADR